MKKGQQLPNIMAVDHSRLRAFFRFSPAVPAPARFTVFVASTCGFARPSVGVLESARPRGATVADLNRSSEVEGRIGLAFDADVWRG